MQRKYSLDDIEKMRRAISAKLGPRTSSTNMTIGGLSQSEKAAQVEDMLRTYILTGSDPDEMAALWGQYIDPRPGYAAYNLSPSIEGDY